MFENVIGASVGWRKIPYTWRDMALYALAVGADENDLMYTYEKDMKAIPSFGVLPYPIPLPVMYKVSAGSCSTKGRLFPPVPARADRVGETGWGPVYLASIPWFS